MKSIVPHNSENYLLFVYLLLNRHLVLLGSNILCIVAHNLVVITVLQNAQKNAVGAWFIGFSAVNCALEQ